MRIDVDAVQRAVNELKTIHASLGAGSGLLGGGGLGSFTAAAGYRDTGRRLGRISGHYAPESLGVLADHVMDAAVTTEANLNNALLADGTLARALRSIQMPAGATAAVGSGVGSQVGYLGAAENYLPNRRVKNSRASNFTPPAPAVGYDPVLLALNNKLATTNFAAPAAEAAFWETVAAKVTTAVQELFGPKQSLATSLETDWVRMGDQRISRIQHAGAVFAANAHQMAAHATALGNAIGSEAVLAAAASATYGSIVQPAARKTFEQAYLAAYPPRATAGLTATVPTFTKLLPDLDRMSGDSFSVNELSRPAAPSFERSPLPQVVREAFAANGHGDLAHAATPMEVISEYGQPNSDVLEAIAAGATPTQAAAVAAPSMPPTLNPATAPAGASGLLAGNPGAPAAAHGRVASAIGSLGSTAALGFPAGRTAAAGSRVGAAAAPAGMSGASVPPPAAGAAAGGGRHRAVDHASPVSRSAADAGRAGVGGGRLATEGSAAPQRGAAGREFGAPGAERAGGLAKAPGAAGAAGPAGRAGNPGTTRAAHASVGEMGGAGLAGAPGMAGKKNHGGAAGAGVAGGAGAGGVSRALGTGSSAGLAGVSGSGSAASLAGAAGSAGMPLAAPGVAAGAGAGPGALRGGAGAPVAGAAGYGAPGAAGGAGQGRSMVGGAPMGGAAGRGGQKQGNKGSKVKTVTSAVEREGNLRALLGDAPLVLPPVIGDSVRG